jgi:hypothetical protein
VDVSNRTDPQPNAPAPPGGEQVLSEPPTADGLSVTVRVVPLSDHESSPLRARQLAVIVDLLRSAAQQKQRGAAPTKRG